VIPYITLSIDGKTQQHRLHWSDTAYMQGSRLHGGWMAGPPLPDDVCEYLNCMIWEGNERSGRLPSGYGDYSRATWQVYGYLDAPGEKRGYDA